VGVATFAFDMEEWLVGTTEDQYAGFALQFDLQSAEIEIFHTYATGSSEEGPFSASSTWAFGFSRDSTGLIEIVVTGTDAASEWNFSVTC
jgi:hypothetical protein